MAFFSLLLLIIFSFQQIYSVRSIRYVRFGAFYISTRSFDRKCRVRGPVDTENEIFNTLGVRKVSRYKELFFGNITIRHDLHNFSNTLITDIWRDGGYKPYFTRTLKKPCENSFMKFILSTFFTVGEGCSVKKGNYSLLGVEPNDVFHKVVGMKFFYEKIAFSLITYSPRGLVSCVKFSYESNPLTKAQRAMNQTFVKLPEI